MSPSLPLMGWHPTFLSVPGLRQAPFFFLVQASWRKRGACAPFFPRQNPRSSVFPVAAKQFLTLFVFVRLTPLFRFPSASLAPFVFPFPLCYFALPPPPPLLPSDFFLLWNDVLVPSHVNFLYVLFLVSSISPA